MATDTPTTRPGAVEDAPFAPTDVTRAFARFLTHLATFVEAERDVEVMMTSDPAFDGSLRRSELALEDTMMLARQSFEAELTRHADRPLRYTAMLLHRALGSETRAEFEGLRGLVDSYRPMFRASGSGPIARRVNVMVDTALRRLDEVSQLRMIAEMCDDPHPDDLVADLVHA
ncbi:hypothetical protein [Falsirhodobacter halotolerans]|uniref:hypothetical protein n=1 Tax=Falsirhodobacter halotolerans TaxID=1146892 RepID=UPI001FD35159|nr:hypothetical protein [Falsirhodobacter halotolerans]MCJ8139945.1 hypothetical protein [Falsirhodobacter halotolerans]